MTDFKPGLEGVVAVETEIAEPDREGGALRYRGRRHRRARRSSPLRERLGAARRRRPRLEDARPRAVRAGTAHRQRAGRPPGRDRAPRRGVEARQAERDLRRAGARGSRPPVRADDDHRRPVGARRRRATRTRSPTSVVAQGATAAEKFLLRWRGEADPRHVKAIDTYWICTAEHGLNASTFTARITASTGADCGAALSSAVGALSGPLHGGAPAYVKPMLDEVTAMGDAEAWVKDALATGEADHGLRAPHLPRRGPALAPAQADGAGARLAVHRTSPRSSSASRSSHSRRSIPERVLATNVEYYSAVVLDIAEIPPPLAPAMFACSRVAGWSAHILEQKRTGRLFRPSARYVGPAERSLSAV